MRLVTKPLFRTDALFNSNMTAPPNPALQRTAALAAQLPKRGCGFDRISHGMCPSAGSGP